MSTTGYADSSQSKDMDAENCAPSSSCCFVCNRFRRLSLPAIISKMLRVARLVCIPSFLVPLKLTSRYDFSFKLSTSRNSYLLASWTWECSKTSILRTQDGLWCECLRLLEDSKSSPACIASINDHIRSIQIRACWACHPDNSPS